jgi:hypothetical protein
MNPNKALWEKGDFTRIAASMRESGEALVAALEETSNTPMLVNPAILEPPRTSRYARATLPAAVR